MGCFVVIIKVCLNDTEFRVLMLIFTGKFKANLGF